jgi:multicomponent Na+:H+ antiporter subunit G
MKELLTAFVLLVGAGFVLLAAVGVVRMPDVFTRMQATSKANTLGLACLARGAAVHFGDWSTATRAAIIVAFFYLTNPVAAHVIARAAYFMEGVSWWRGTVIDELQGRYDPETHRLHSGEEREQG